MEILTYILKVNLIFSITFLGYVLVTRKTVFHQWNRFFLLLAPVFALLLPSLNFGGEAQAIYTVEIPEVLTTGTATGVAGDQLGWETVLLWIWIAGCTIAFIGMVRNILKSQAAHSNSLGSSFFGKIHIDGSVVGETRERIYRHEKVHADQWHTLDLLWYEILRVAFWFNPLFLIGRCSLKELHEYIADSVANQQTEQYAETLVASAFGISTLPLANEFNSINIKNRIKMMTKKKSRGQRMTVVSMTLLMAFAAVSIGWTAIVVPSEVGKEEVYEKVEKMPRFPGCDESQMRSADELKKCSMKYLIDFMVKNVEYPKKAKEENTEGTVRVKYIVTKEGEIIKAHVVKGVSEELDAEALRVVNAMPNWVPGEDKGKKVNVSMVLPISFKMDS